MKTRLFLALFAALVLAGCSTILNAEMKVAQTILDSEIQSAETVICKFIPMSTWQRLYGTSADRAEGWSKLCNTAAFLPKVSP